MAGPNTPATASGPIPPPIANLQFVLQNRFLSPSGLQFLQLLWAAIQGGGGIIDIIDAAPESPGLVGASIRSLQEQDVRSALAQFPGALAALERVASDFRPGGAPQIREISSSPVLWTPGLVGSTTPGTQTYAVQTGLYAEFGPMSVASFSITLSALDAATAGNLQISGLPRPANDQQASGGSLGAWGGISLSASYTQLGLSLAAGSANLALIQAGSAQPSLALPATGASATTTISGTITYFR